MKNPWEEIPLADYENHMRLDSVMQLQTLSEMMGEQFAAYPASSVMILGVAGGNGLERIPEGRFERVWGVDVNASYLDEAAGRYPGVLECLRVDLTKEADRLPQAGMVIANLLIEYIGCACFQRVIRRVCPEYVSCVIQVNPADDWVSDSPYLRVFDGLERIHRQIGREELTDAMLEIGLRPVKSLERGLPNGKKLLRLDFQK